MKIIKYAHTHILYLDMEIDDVSESNKSQLSNQKKVI